jgi:hypothetical protein
MFGAEDGQTRAVSACEITFTCSITCISISDLGSRAALASVCVKERWIVCVNVCVRERCKEREKECVRDSV